MEARPSNNSTRIACTAVGTFSNQHDFEEGTLIIAGDYINDLFDAITPLILLAHIYNTHAGPPSAPVVEFTQSHLINGSIGSYLSWSAPFTFDGFPITNYSVTKLNLSNGESTTITQMANCTDCSHHSISQGDHCYELDFTVTAINRLGSSLPATINTGHPIGTQG